MGGWEEGGGGEEDTVLFLDGFVLAAPVPIVFYLWVGGWVGR